jgi:hypothetical protein
VFQDQYNYLWKLAKKGEWDKLMDECTSLITEMEEHPSTKSRHERAHQMRKNLKVRKERFVDPDKKMLKLVINSIMQRYQAPQHLTSVESEGDMKYSEKAVAKGITKYFKEWMGSKVGVREWRGEEGDTEEEAWDRMMDLDTSHIADPKIKEFIEVAYLRSFRHYGQLQEDEDIWGSVMKKITVGDLREEMMKFRANKAPGPSGVSIEMVKLMSDENLERLVGTMNGIMTEGSRYMNHGT